MPGSMVIGHIVCQVLNTWAPVNNKLILDNIILDPIDTNINCLGVRMFHCVVKEPQGSFVVNLNGGCGLGMVHFF